MSKRRQEGYLLIDNRFGPGVSEEFIRKSGRDAPVVGEGQMFEAPTITCAHCHTVLVVNPARTRERGYCRKCDHYICDNCSLIAHFNGGKCVPMSKVLDEVQNASFKGEEHVSSVIQNLRKEIQHG